MCCARACSDSVSFMNGINGLAMLTVELQLPGHVNRNFQSSQSSQSSQRPLRQRAPRHELPDLAPRESSQSSQKLPELPESSQMTPPCPTARVRPCTRYVIRQPERKSWASMYTASRRAILNVPHTRLLHRCICLQARLLYAGLPKGLVSSICTRRTLSRRRIQELIKEHYQAQAVAPRLTYMY